jgi:putative hydrolase of the HAD superfamily
MAPRFFYFDIGNVLLWFDPERLARQVGQVAGISAERVWDAVYETDLSQQLECGKISSRELFAAFCRQTGTQPDFAAFLRAAASIFELNVPLVPIVAHLRAAGHRLGLLSNTNEVHWNYMNDGRYTIFRRCFECHVLSFQIGAMKPDAEIFQAAIRMAGVPPSEIFFVDDRQENVEGARQVGIDAVRFLNATHLAHELRRRGVRFNY